MLILVIGGTIVEGCLHLLDIFDNSMSFIGKLSFLPLCCKYTEARLLLETYAVTNRSWLCNVSDRAVKSYRWL